MADLAYCTPAGITALAGQLAVDLRTDDVPDLAAHLAAAVDHASGRIDFYCSRYAGAELAASRWVTGVAELIALRWLCLHRLNERPKVLEEEWAERKEELELIREGKATVPNAAATRRPLTVTNYGVDDRRWNGKVRVDANRSTGVPGDLPRRTDPTAPPAN
jgi:hypothetical protein